jgi:glutamine amidotransferase
VGAFADCMANLERYNLVEPIKDFIAEGKPFLGICVGYQLLFDKSEEHGDNKGLGILRGKCIRFDFDPSLRLKIPHMGWNQVRYGKNGRLFEGINDGTDFYFVHSYYPVPEDDGIITSSTDYGVTFASSIEKENIFATQFHPEKSQRAGLDLVRNFAKICGEI